MVIQPKLDITTWGLNLMIKPNSTLTRKIARIEEGWCKTVATKEIIPRVLDMMDMKGKRASKTKKDPINFTTIPILTAQWILELLTKAMTTLWGQMKCWFCQLKKKTNTCRI